MLVRNLISVARAQLKGFGPILMFVLAFGAAIFTMSEETSLDISLSESPMMTSVLIGIIIILMATIVRMIHGIFEIMTTGDDSSDESDVLGHLACAVIALVGLHTVWSIAAAAPLSWVGIAFLAATELVYWLDRKSLRSASLAHVALKKLEAAADVLFAAGLAGLAKGAYDWLGLNFQTVLLWFGYIGLALLACGVVYAYLRLNAMAYRRKAGRPRKDG